MVKKIERIRGRIRCVLWGMEVKTRYNQYQINKSGQKKIFCAHPYLPQLMVDSLY